MAVARTVILLAAALAAGLQAQSGVRVRENFNRGWLFARQVTGSGELGSFDRNTDAAARIEPRFRNAINPTYDDSEWKTITLPHTWNAHDVTDETPGYWRGIGWYRKHFTVSTKYVGRRFVLELEGVNLVSEFWLNGARLGSHQGGYTGFEFDLTPHLRLGRDNVLTAKVDNLFHGDVPPTVKTDYSFYGGIYRDAWLRITNTTYIDEVRWSTPGVSRKTAKLDIYASVRRADAAGAEMSIAHEVVDTERRAIATLSGKIGASLTLAGVVERPRLWSPRTPNLYTIRTTLREGGNVVDAVETPLGFRWFHFDPGQGFFLNGQRVQLQGVNWHQSYPGMGNALPNSRHWKDIGLIKEMGCNFWRTSHYPHDPATMEASDRLGLMVWEELPVNKEIGNPSAYIANAVTMAKEMIRRDRNHPSVIVWGFAGEVNAPKVVSKLVIAEVAKTYRELDPTRPVGMHEPRGEEIEALVDVVGLGAGKETDSRRRQFPKRSYMTAEYSAALVGRGIYGGGADSEELGCDRHEAYLRELARRPWMAGGLIWNAFDYDGESYDSVIPHIVSFGMTDIWRFPKDVFYFYQSQWSERAMVHIVGHWTWRGQEGRQRSVRVYSNAPEVELFLNGRSLGMKRDTPERHNGEPAGLKHPPRFWSVDYQPGTLRAVARGAGPELVDEKWTAGPPYQIALQTDSKELRSGDPESLAYLTAVVMDKDNHPVPDAYPPISFTSYGPGELLPQTWLGHGTGLTWNAIAGMTRIAFRATSRTGTAVISAWSPGLRMGRVEMKISAPGKPNEMDYRERFEEDEVPVTGKAR